jgi:hypothetical protein
MVAIARPELTVERVGHHKSLVTAPLVDRPSCLHCAIVVVFVLVLVIPCVVHTRVCLFRRGSFCGSEGMEEATLVTVVIDMGERTELAIPYPSITFG